MSSQPTGRPRITAEVLAQRKLEIARIKAEAEEKNKQRAFDKSAIFRGPVGKILKLISLLIILFCSLIIVDGWLGKTSAELKIKSSSEDKVNLIKGGYLVTSTFNWAYLDDDEKFGIHMHHEEFDRINEIGVINLKSSPILNVPSEFTVKNILGINEHHTLRQDYGYRIVIPLLLILLSILWLFSKPHKSMQWVMYGYINMIVSPLLLIFLIIKVLAFINGVGMYEIDVISIVS